MRELQLGSCASWSATAYRHVPFMRCMRELGIVPDDIRSLDDRSKPCRS